MDKKKITAALAAVAMYMKTREEAVLSSAAVIPEPEPITEPHALIQAARPFNVWGISGRQSHMQANAMMQLRMFK
jgi:hypothetical protein